MLREHRLTCKKNNVPRTLLVRIILFRVRSSSTVFRIAHTPENKEGAFIMKILLVLSGNLDCPTLKSDWENRKNRTCVCWNRTLDVLDYVALESEWAKKRKNEERPFELWMYECGKYFFLCLLVVILKIL